MPKLPDHDNLIAQLNAVTSPDELAAILSTISHLDSPGFPNDLADGHYFDGAFFATKRGSVLVVTGKHTLSSQMFAAWEALDRRQRDAHHATADADRETRDARRGRPEIGRRITTRLPDWLIRRVDQYADAHDLGRAEAMRHLLAAGLSAAKS